MREEEKRVEEGEEDQEAKNELRPKKLLAKMAKLHRSQKLGEGSKAQTLDWRV